MDNTVLAELVTKARSGCRESMGLLSERYQNDVYRYIYRLTLNRSIAEDIQQETLLQMCRSLDNLRDAENLKAWLLKIAWRKAMNHYRSTLKQACMSIDKNNLVNALESKHLEGLKTLISKEIAETLVRSISKLNVKQRSAVLLRCYENLSYTEIASIMECSETAARIHFFRGKNELRQHLKRKGITTIPMFLGLLDLFGQVTSPAEAAVTVSATTLKVGPLGTIIGLGLSKIGIFLLSLIGAVAVLSGTQLLQSDRAVSFSRNGDNQVKSYHFTKHAWKDAYIPTANLRMGRSLSKGAYEQWFFFPEGIDGPLLKMVQRWDPEVENKLCSWLLNEQGQHYYHSGENIIYLLDTPLAQRRTARFPCDDQEFCDFLDKVEGIEEGLEYIRDPKTGLLIQIVDRRFANAKDFVSGVDRNTFDETEFGNFHYRWDENAEFIDERDAIHKQGWTQFQISGQIDGKKVYGQCRIPFVYGTPEQFFPLLVLNIGNQYSIVDSPEGAFVLDPDNKVIVSYPSESFFKGLLRPWFGLHTIDLLRREAATCRIPFEVENHEYDGYSFQQRILTLHQASGDGNLKISFDIDIEEDRISQIVFFNRDTLLGTLTFSYPSDPESMDTPIEMPTVRKRWFSEKESPGILWLFDLAQGTLAR